MVDRKRGRGRPAKAEAAATVAFRVPRRVLEEIERRARADRRTRSDWLRLHLEETLGLPAAG